MTATPIMIIRYIQRALHGTDWQAVMAALPLMQTVFQSMRQITIPKFTETGIVYFLMIRLTLQ